MRRALPSARPAGPARGGPAHWRADPGCAGQGEGPGDDGVFVRLAEIRRQLYDQGLRGCPADRLEQAPQLPGLLAPLVDEGGVGGRDIDLDQIDRKSTR